MKLCVLQLVHRRHQYLHVIWEHFRRLEEYGIEVCFSIGHDMASDAVSKVVVDFSRVGVTINEVPFRVLDDGVSRVMPARKFLHEQALDVFQDITHFLIWDDDMVFARIEDVAKMMHEGHDIISGCDLMVWDHPKLINLNFRPHYRDMVFKHVEGDEFVDDHGPYGSYVSRHVTEKLYQENRHHREANELKTVEFQPPDKDKLHMLQSPVLHFGYYTAEDRRKTLEQWVRAGKVDTYIQNLELPAKYAYLVEQYLPMSEKMADCNVHSVYGA